MLPKNFAVLMFYNAHLSEAIVNLAPFATTPIFGLDAPWLRLTLEAEQIPPEEWPDVIQQMQVVHRSREEARRKNG